MFKRIIAACDGSEGSKNALKIAAGLQKTWDGELHIITIFRHHSMLEASMSMVRPEEPQNLDDALREHAKQIAEEAKTLAQAEGARNVRAFVKSGQPARSLVKLAREHEADLIVLGSRGLGDGEGFLLGSVSHKVTSLAGCPVLVV